MATLYRFAVLVAVFALLLLIDGALVTGNAAATPPAVPGLAEMVHPWLGVGVALAIFILWLWIRRVDHRRGVEGTAFALAVLVSYIAQNGSRLTPPAGVWMGTLHALLAHLFFAGVVAIVVCTSPGWQRGPDLVEDYGWPSLRSLAISTPVVVLIQVGLGAGLRHKSMGALSHIGFAMVTALWVLFKCICVIQQFPKHRALRPMATGLLAVTFTQVFLGIGAFTLRTMDVTGPALAAVTSAHVATGAITLAVAVALSIHVRRNVMPKGSLNAAVA